MSLMMNCCYCYSEEEQIVTSCSPNPNVTDCSNVADVKRWFYSQTKSECVQVNGGKCALGMNAYASETDCSAACGKISLWS